MASILNRATDYRTLSINYPNLLPYNAITVVDCGYSVPINKFALVWAESCSGDSVFYNISLHPNGHTLTLTNQISERCIADGHRSVGGSTREPYGTPVGTLFLNSGESLHASFYRASSASGGVGTMVVKVLEFEK